MFKFHMADDDVAVEMTTCTAEECTTATRRPDVIPAFSKYNVPGNKMLSLTKRNSLGTVCVCGT